MPTKFDKTKKNRKFNERLFTSTKFAINILCIFALITESCNTIASYFKARYKVSTVLRPLR